MATATQAARARMGEGRDDAVRASHGAVTAPAPPSDPEPTDRSVYRCGCGHVLRALGGGRHRVYFELGNTGLDDPVMDRACPACGRGLSGSHRR
jgi:hypothetical protein